MPCLGFQACPFAVGAGVRAEESGEILAHHGGFSLVIAPLHVGQDAFEFVASCHRVATVVEEVEVDNLLAAAMQHGIAMLAGQLLQRRVHLEAIGPGQRSEHLEVIKIAAIPATNCAFGETQ